jgi:hypothetical protein
VSRPPTLSLECRSMTLFVCLVDLFFMKTCHFRGARPVQPSLFCASPPTAHYAIEPCQHPSCTYCSRSHDQPPSTVTVIPFHKKSIHPCVNGYRTILNCPAVRCLICVDALSSSQLETFISSFFRSRRHVTHRILSMH